MDGTNGFTLEEEKEMRLNHFRAKRDFEEMKPVMYNGHYFDFDTKSFDRINAAIVAVGSGSINWTTADNDVVSMTADDLRGVIITAASRSNELHIHYRNLKVLVMAAETIEEVLAVEW